MASKRKARGSETDTCHIIAKRRRPKRKISIGDKFFESEPSDVGEYMQA